MITGLMLIISYILPLPIMAACLYYHVFDGVQDVMMRLIYIGIASLAPSAVIMLFVLKRVVHFIIKVLIVAAILYGLHHFGLIGHTATQGKP